jgi:hypothetical protein
MERPRHERSGFDLCRELWRCGEYEVTFTILPQVDLSPSGISAESTLLRNSKEASILEHSLLQDCPILILGSRAGVLLARRAGRT